MLKESKKDRFIRLAEARVASFGIRIKDEFFVEWQKAVSQIGEVTQYAEKAGLSDKILNLIYTVIYGLMYMEYDITQEFMPQFMKNKENLLDFLQNMPGFKFRRAI